MRRGPDRWLSGQSWDDDDHRPRRVEAPDPAVSYVNGQAFRRETSRHDPDNVIRPDEQKMMGQRAQEAAEARLAEVDWRFRRALELGEALRELGN